MRKAAVVVTALALAGIVGPAASAAERAGRTARKTDARTVPSALAVIGTITYDTGINVGFYPDSVSGNLNRLVGNRFDSQLGHKLMMTNMVTMITVFPANDGLQSVSIAGPPDAMGSAMVLDYVAANLMANQFNAILVNPGVTVGPDFLGLFLGAFFVSQPLGLVGMSDMGTMGQGYHAIDGFYGAPQGLMATMIQVVPNRNAMVRATIDLLVPVELMDFRLE